MNNNNKIILDLCGGTGSWSLPYKKARDEKDNPIYNVRNITLPEYDVRTYKPPENVYGILAAPPCTEFSFAKTNSKYPRNIRKGMELVIACLKIIWECQYNLPTVLAKRTNLEFWCLENPFGLLRRYLGHPVIIIEPYHFGDAYQKKTCLWGFFNIPKVNVIKNFSKEYIHTISPDGKKLKKFDKLLTKEINFNENTKHLSRTERRAITPPGFAKAFYGVNK